MRALAFLLLAAASARAAAPPDSAAMVRDLDATQNRHEAVCERMRALQADIAAADKTLLDSAAPDDLLERRDATGRRMKELSDEAGRLDWHERNLAEGLQFALIAGNLTRDRGRRTPASVVPAEERLSEYISRRDRLGQCTDRVFTAYDEEERAFTPVRAAYEARRKTRRRLLWGALGVLAAAAAACALVSGSSRTAGPA